MYRLWILSSGVIVGRYDCKTWLENILVSLGGKILENEGNNGMGGIVCFLEYLTKIILGWENRNNSRNRLHGCRFENDFME